MAKNNLGMAYTALRDFELAEDHLYMAVTQLRELGDQLNLENALGNLGNEHLQIHKPDLAAHDYQEALRM